MFWGTKPKMIVLERKSWIIFLDYKKMEIDSLKNLIPSKNYSFTVLQKLSWMECVKSSGFRGH